MLVWQWLMDAMVGRRGMEVWPLENQGGASLDGIRKENNWNDPAFRLPCWRKGEKSQHPNDFGIEDESVMALLFAHYYSWNNLYYKNEKFLHEYVCKTL